MRPQKLTKIQSNQFKNQLDIIYRTHLKRISEPLARRSQTWNLLPSGWLLPPSGELEGGLRVYWSKCGDWLWWI